MHKENQLENTNGRSVIRMSQLSTTPKRKGMLPLSPATLWRWVKSGEFPQPFKLGLNTTVWSVADVDDWLENQRGKQ